MVDHLRASAYKPERNPSCNVPRVTADNAWLSVRFCDS